MKKIVIIGAGGYAKVLAETIELLEGIRVTGFVDDNIAAGTPVFGALKVLGSISDIPKVSDQCDTFVIGIGNNEVRKQIANQFSGKINFETLVHPRAFVADTVFLSEGTVVLAGAVISSNTKIGQHSIINSNVVADHDCEVGDFVHLAIGTLLGSNSVVSDSLKTEIGQVISVFSRV